MSSFSRGSRGSSASALSSSVSSSSWEVHGSDTGFPRTWGCSQFATRMVRTELALLLKNLKSGLTIGFFSDSLSCQALFSQTAEQDSMWPKK
uniref:Uncharacterized protein n=1 Tax=Ixodes ricinus TaxID=34613 RepID=A0A6B0UB93_IXORI